MVQIEFKLRSMSIDKRLKFWLNEGLKLDDVTFHLPTLFKLYHRFLVIFMVCSYLVNSVHEHLRVIRYLLFMMKCQWFPAQENIVIHAYSNSIISIYYNSLFINSKLFTSQWSVILFHTSLVFNIVANI